jgi:hypothetical protein
VFDDVSGVAMGIEDRAGTFAKHLVVDTHRRDGDHSVDVSVPHRSADGFGLHLHIPGQGGIDHILTLHRVPLPCLVQHIALANTGAISPASKPPRVAGVERQRGVGSREDLRDARSVLRRRE